jgi:hypothetical protein
MMLEDVALDPSVIEVLTGSPFGMHLAGGTLPFFDPDGWDPNIGLDAATALLGWSCERTAGGDDNEAIERLCQATSVEPVLVGPVEMGLLLHQPGSGQAIGADHFVVAMAVEDATVCFHDPHGHPLRDAAG